MNSYYAYDLIFQTGVSNLELEKAISKNVYCSWSYASNVLRSMFKLGEGVISKHGHYSYIYARDVLKGRFKLGEDVISKNSYHCFNYFVKILGHNHE